MRRTIFIAIVLGLSGITSAQTKETSESKDLLETAICTPNAGKVKILDNLDLAITCGTTGIGLELSTPINEYIQVRAGYDFMPHFEKTMHFQVQMQDNDYSRNLYETDRDAYYEYMQGRFDRLSGKLYDLMGLEVDNNIDMIGKPTMNHFKLLVDVYPFKDKRWHVTGGFYYSPSACIAKALNSAHDATAPVGVSIYNKLVDRLHNNVEKYEYSYEEDGQIINVIEYGLTVNEMSLWFSNQDESNATMYSLCSAIYNNEKMGVNMGTLKDGSSYTLFPDEDNTLSAKMLTNRFKPYLGFGFDGYMTKNQKNGLKIGFDCGILFWGGKPKIVTHDGTDLSRDVTNLRGQVKDYVNISNKFVIYPAINLRISKTIFIK